MTKDIRPIRVEGNIAYVQLTRGYEAIIDASDAVFVGKFNWHARVMPRSVYAARTEQRGERRYTVLMHRALMNDPFGLQVDHIDCNGLNNCRKNLRSVTKNQNMHNQRVRCDNSSGLKGVTFNKKAGMWYSQIRVNGRRLHLGSFEDKHQAYAAYCLASFEMHGKFGRTRQ